MRQPGVIAVAVDLTSLEIELLRQFHTYSDPARDPRDDAREKRRGGFGPLRATPRKLARVGYP